MSQRSSLVLFCFASALAGGIVATQSAGRDRATAQISQALPSAALVAFPRQYPTWKYWYGIVPAFSRAQILPPGTSGVIHSIITSNSVDVAEGGEGIDNRIIHCEPGSQSQRVLDAIFTDGLKVIFDNNGAATITVLYALDAPISTNPER